MANCCQIVRNSAMDSMESLRKPPSLFRMVPSPTPYDHFLLPKIGSENEVQDQLRDACCHLANMIEDIDKLFAVPYVIMSPATSPFA